MRNDIHIFVNNAIKLSLELGDARVVNVFAGDMYDYTKGFNILHQAYKNRKNDRGEYALLFEDLRDLIVLNILEEVTMYSSDNPDGFAIEVAERLKMLGDA